MQDTKSELTVTLDTGRIRGQSAGGIRTFLGIPFAAPPVGSLRFQAPQPVAKWDGVRDCLDYGPTAPQPHRADTLIPEPVVDGDDYLNLNVFTGARPGERQPVLVWIHGGGFFAGCNRSPWWAGHRFARDGVVLVSVNYRLGAEGFMPIKGAPANRGVLDWIAALQWVQRNIAAFGGDPSQVTIAGQSAGAMACTYLLTIPRAKGLFHRVIGMSGSIGMGLTAERANRIAKDFAAFLGANDDVAALAKIPAQIFVEAQGRFMTLESEADSPNQAAERIASGLKFQPVVDGDVIPQSATQAIKLGVGENIPVLLSFTAEEFDFMVAGGDAPYAEADLKRGLMMMGYKDAAVAAHVELHRALPPKKALGRALSDRLFRARGVTMAELRVGAPAPTYLCEFRWSPKPPVAEGFGACHCIDVPFAFDVLDAPKVARLTGRQLPQHVADRYHRAFVDFTKSGNAGWSPYRAEQRAALFLDDASAEQSDPFRMEKTIWNATDWIAS